MDTESRYIAIGLVFAAALQSCAGASAEQSRHAGMPSEQGADTTDAALESLHDRPAWLFPMDECPADVAPAAEREVRHFPDACNPDLQFCLSRCEASDASLCYAAALRLQDMEANADYSEALFLRACRLGVRSGCTNRAAGILAFESERENGLACATRTFEMMCESNDPWACTMFGSHLVQGLGTKRDPERALEVLPKGCLLGQDDPACTAAKKLIVHIKVALD